MMFSLGDRIRCQIDDKWWKGTVQKVEHHEGSKRSPFLSIFVHWDNNEKEYLSPWDLVSMLLNFFLVVDNNGGIYRKWLCLPFFQYSHFMIRILSI